MKWKGPGVPLETNGMVFLGCWKGSHDLPASKDMISGGLSCFSLVFSMCEVESRGNGWGALTKDLRFALKSFKAKVFPHQGVHVLCTKQLSF